MQISSDKKASTPAPWAEIVKEIAGTDNSSSGPYDRVLLGDSRRARSDAATLGGLVGEIFKDLLPPEPKANPYEHLNRRDEIDPLLLMLGSSSREAPIRPEVIKLEADVAQGKEVSAKEVQRVALVGSAAECALIRKALQSPAAMVRNQDLLLTALVDAVRGSRKAQTRYESERFILAEALAPWSRECWDREANAAWRRFNLHGPEMTRFADRIRGSVDEAFTSIKIEAADRCIEDSDLEVLGRRDSMLTFTRGREILATIHKAVLSAQYDRKSLYDTADYEIRSGSLFLYSPTPIGTFYREVVDRELRMLLAAFVVEDASVAYNLPLSNEAKGTLWERARENIWRFASSGIFQKLSAEAESLRAKNLDDDQIELSLSGTCLSRDGLDKLMGITKKQKPAALPSVRTGRGSPDVHGATHQSKSLVIKAALETQFGQRNDIEKMSRILGKLASDSDALLERVLTAISNGVEPNNIVEDVRLRKARSLQSVRNDASTTQTAIATPQLMAAFAALEEPQKELPQFHFSPEAQKELVDGRVRHAVDTALERYAERPELADIKRIQEVASVWELRLLRENMRVYFYRPLPNQVAVLLVGGKEDQKHDIKRLQRIKDAMDLQFGTARP